MSRKGAKSGTRGRKLRSTGTKKGKRVGRIREPRADFEQQLAACRRELVDNGIKLRPLTHAEPHGLPQRMRHYENIRKQDRGIERPERAKM